LTRTRPIFEVRANSSEPFGWDASPGSTPHCEEGPKGEGERERERERERGREQASSRAASKERGFVSGGEPQDVAVY